MPKTSGGATAYGCKGVYLGNTVFAPVLGSPRLHVRCIRCASLITGYPEQRFCKECGAQCEDMPLF